MCASYYHFYALLGHLDSKLNGSTPNTVHCMLKCMYSTTQTHVHVHVQLHVHLC